MTPRRAVRAAPLPPEDRRDAIVLAAIPLLRARGAAVTTRELADAAGVAEGTLFRVFPDKVALVRAAVARALDPAPVLAELAGVAPTLPLRPALSEVVAILQTHARDVALLLAVTHELAHAPGASAPAGHRGPPHHPHAHDPVEKVVRGVADVLEPRSAHLRLDTVVCARMLVGLVLAGNRPLTSQSAPALDPHELTALFLDGALTRPDPVEDPC